MLPFLLGETPRRKGPGGFMDGRERLQEGTQGWETGPRKWPGLWSRGADSGARDKGLAGHSVQT